MDQKKRKLMTIEALHSKDNILYMCQNRRTKGLASCGNCKDYFKKNKERSISATGNSTYNIRTNRTTTKTRKQKWEEKQPHGYFKQQTGEISHEKT